MYSFRNLEPVCCSMSSSNCCFLTCIQVSQDAGKVVWHSHLFKNFPGVVLRWQRNRKGRPLSPPQSHWKIIWTLSKFHKTTSECWQRTPGTQKGHQTLQKEVGQNIKDKNRDKRVWDGDPSQGGSREGGDFQTPENPLTGGYVSLRGKHNQEEKKTSPRITCLTATPSGEVAQTLGLSPASRGWTGRCGCIA